MHTNILIPHDFSELSLSLARHAIVRRGSEPIQIVMTHCMFLPNSIIDLLYFSKSELIRSLETPEFKKAYQALVKKGAEKHIRIRTDVFTGITQRAFRNFLDANKIGEAIIPDPYRYAPSQKDSFDPLPYIRRSRLRITEVSVPLNHYFYDDLTEFEF